MSVILDVSAILDVSEISDVSVISEISDVSVILDISDVSGISAISDFSEIEIWMSQKSRIVSRILEKCSSLDITDSVLQLDYETQLLYTLHLK